MKRPLPKSLKSLFDNWFRDEAEQKLRWRGRLRVHKEERIAIAPEACLQARRGAERGGRSHSRRPLPLRCKQPAAVETNYQTGSKVLWGALGFVASFAHAADLWTASVNYSGKRITGRPAANHRPIAQAVHVAESEECATRSIGTSAMEVSDRCAYLRGLYRYIFVPENGGPKRQVLMGFSLRRMSSQSHAFLAETPIEVEESPPN